jgi:hypothetical protein
MRRSLAFFAILFVILDFFVILTFFVTLREAKGLCTFFDGPSTKHPVCLLNSLI